MNFRCTAVCTFAVMLATTTAMAGEADVVDVRMSERGGSYTFTVTVRHADAGWEHYADNWEVLAPDGTVIDTRVLLHPHDNEQPFTRSLSGVKIPSGMPSVRIRAHDKVHGNGGIEIIVDMKTGESKQAGSS